MLLYRILQYPLSVITLLSYHENLIFQSDSTMVALGTCFWNICSSGALGWLRELMNEILQHEVPQNYLCHMVSRAYFTLHHGFPFISQDSLHEITLTQVLTSKDDRCGEVNISQNTTQLENIKNVCLPVVPRVVSLLSAKRQQVTHPHLGPDLWSILQNRHTRLEN